MKIRTKYPLFVALITLLIGVALAVAMVMMAGPAWRKQLIATNSASSEFLATAAAPLLLSESYEQLKFQLVALKKDPAITNAAIFNVSRDPVATLGSAPPTLPTDLDPSAASHRTSEDGLTHWFYMPVHYGTTRLGTLVLETSEAPMRARLDSNLRLTLLLSAAVCALVLAISLVLVRRELKPLNAISNTLDLISGGDFSVRLPVTRNDELGALSLALNNMLVRSELFFRYVDKLIIERLVTNPALARPGGRETDIVVVFGDMRRFTDMSNRLSADEVVRTVNLYFHLFIDCVARMGGVVDKTMGDAIMVVFERNPGQEAHDHEVRATMAMAAMKASSRVVNRLIERHRSKFANAGIEPCEWGFALASGQAIVGNIGSSRRMDYTVMGRVVNLASRLEGLTKRGECVLSPEMLSIVEPSVDSLPMQAVTLKGFESRGGITPSRIVGLKPPHDDAMKRFLKNIFSNEILAFLLNQVAGLDIEALRKDLAQIIDTSNAQELFGRMKEAPTGKGPSGAAPTAGAPSDAPASSGSSES